MLRSKLTPHAQDIIAAYRNGQSAASLARQYGASTTTTTRLLINAGVMAALPRGGAMKRSDEAEILKAYRRGELPSEICRSFRLSKSGLYSILRRNDASLRGHVGWKPGLEHLSRSAASKESSGQLTKGERAFQDIMVKLGYELLPQMAIGVGNVDFVIPTHSVAVEISFRGTFHKYVRSGWFENRIRDLGDCGWHTYVLATLDTESFLRDGVEDICAWLDFIRRQPSTRRQYRVVWRAAHLVATGCSDDEKFSFVLASTGS